MRNFGIFLLSFFCIFAPYTALELLQSSLNRSDGLGVYSLSILYALKALSSLFGPLIVRGLTPKWTLLLAYLCHTIFIASNFYPKWYSMLPAGILLGIATGPLWICSGIYTTVLGVYYSKAKVETNIIRVQSKFHGLHSLAMSFAMICGNIVSSVVLKFVSSSGTSFPNSGGIEYSNNTSMGYNTSASEIRSNVNSLNEDVFTTELHVSSEESSTVSNDIIDPIFKDDKLDICGPYYCPSSHKQEMNDTGGSDVFVRPDDVSVYTLLSIMLACNLCGVLLLLFGLQNIPAEALENKEDNSKILRQKHGNSKPGCCKGLANYFKRFFHWKYIALIPSISYIYLALAINNSSFYAAYVTCSQGIASVGILAMTAGISIAVVNYVSGLLGQYVHRNVLFLVAFMAYLGMYGVMLLWDSFSGRITLYIISAMFGVGVGINMPQFSGKFLYHKKWNN